MINVKLQNLNKEIDQGEQKMAGHEEKEKKKEESFLESPFGGLVIIAGITAVGAGLYSLFKKG